jgi:two-component system OmpR family response regulator
MSHRPTILVVDDDRDLRELLATLLEEEGYEVATANDGRSALEEVRRHRPTLILLDMKMPVMDGWHFCANLREAGVPPPIVVITAAANAEGRAAEVGADGWLSRPFELDALLTLVHHFAPTAPPPNQPAAY